jgi:transcriptional regulator with GAF, ATPase, and Fis domain
MPDSIEALLGHFGGRFVQREAYAGGEGTTLRVTESLGDAAADRVLKVLAAGAEPQEAALLLSLQHPAIPAIREVGRLPDGRAFVVRDHVVGEALNLLPADRHELLAIVQELLEVLAYVHLRSVVHLDLKPQNLLRDEHGRLHLLDFGLGARRGEHGRGGTLFFAAPELLLGGVPDTRADLFSVGAMVAQALWPGGRLPLHHFVARFPNEDFFAAAGVRAEDFPAPFDQFLTRCLSRRPARRFQDAQEALEFLCGGSGRPSPSLLAPDPVALFGPELALAATAEEARDLMLHGGDAQDRRALAMHLVATTCGARELREASSELRVVRGGGATFRIDLPDLDPVRLQPHLLNVLGLQGNAAITAAAWLVHRGARSGAGVHEQLLGLVRSGEVVPSGSRWSWPAAFSGRLSRESIDVPGLAATPANVRLVAARGQRELAIGLWREGAAADAHREPALREALAEGLLEAGEAAQALPFCTQLPLLRAQAFLDMGQVDGASREIESVKATDAAAQLRLGSLQARIHMVRGQYAAAVQSLRRPHASPRERLLLATAYNLQGDAARSEILLAALLGELAAEQQPFLRASAFLELGHVHRRLGDLAAGERAFTEAAELLFGLGHVRHVAKVQQDLGVIAKDRGDHAQAVARFREARTLFQHVGDQAGVAVVEANLGIAALARGDASAARPWLLQATPVLLRLGNLAAGRLAQVMLARAHAELGDRDAAESVLAELGTPDTDRLRDEVAGVHAAFTASVAANSESEDLAAAEDDSMPPNQGPSRELFRTFLAVNRQLAQETDLDKAMRHLLDAAVTLTGGRQGYLLVARDDGMRREFQSGDPGPTGQAFSRSLAHRAMQLQRTLTGADGLADRELQEMPSVRNLQVRSAICAPFRSAGGTVGAIYVEHPGRAGAFQESDKDALEVLADQAAIAVDRMLREESLATELHASRRELAVAKRAVRRESTQLIGDSSVMRELRAQIQKLAPLELPVLILGETGSGKELVARALHEQGARSRGPFVAENCSALPAELMERELFGHVQGSFTGADRDRPGLLELASGGTLFLDEVGDMPPALQVKLLRALQEQAIRRVGGSETIRLDLRLLAATHRDLRAMVQQGEFREDLFFRLAAVELRVPPLRDRGDDRIVLAEHFLRRHGEQNGRQLRLGAIARSALQSYPWPGNVRELDHVIARVALLSTADEIVDLQLPVVAAVPAGTVGSSAAPEVVTLKEAERRAIVVAMQACGGDKAKTARVLEISRTALYEKLKRLGLS